MFTLLRCCSVLRFGLHWYRLDANSHYRYGGGEMKPLHIIDGAVWFALVLTLILCLPHIAFADPRGGNPHIHVDDAIGDDSNAGMTETQPVTTSNGRWSRVLELGIMGADTGIVAHNISDTPSVQWVRDAMREKPDRVYRSNRREVIPGHGQLPDEDIEESGMTGTRIRIKYIWETFTAPNGQIAERMINVVETVEAY
jgi:hypothetical protein